MLALKDIYFPERTREVLLAIARRQMGIERTGRLHEFLVGGVPTVKDRDVRLLVARIRRDVEKDAPPATFTAARD